MSPTSTPATGRWSSRERICTTKGCGPWSLPFVNRRAMHMTCVAVLPSPPGHHLVELSVGLSMTHSIVRSSYVAVVSRPRRYVPWPSSVCAYVPMMRLAFASGSHLWRWSSSPMPSMVGMNMPRWRSSGPGSSTRRRMWRYTSPSSKPVWRATAFALAGVASCMRTVRACSSSRAQKYLPALLKAGSARRAAAAARRIAATSAPPARAVSSSEAGKLARARSRSMSSRGSTAWRATTAPLSAARRAARVSAPPTSREPSRVSGTSIRSIAPPRRV
mmetsp:Transcript_10815/g.37552  ORF Transcript_10815/g.37552 Transcript_10815/m.37552 type:complete len:275 (+) Transcript_10815:294-1118(+)